MRLPMNRSDMKDLFILDPEIIFLNHGSFGACPKEVFEVYQGWQRELERQPVLLLDRRAVALMAGSRGVLASYLNVDADEVVFFPNPTTAVNMVARNLERWAVSGGKIGEEKFLLRPGDEVLATDQEYGALNRTWRYICKNTGARYVTVPIPLPLEDPNDFIERFWAAVNERTKLIFISHITSPTALIFPIKEVCRRARIEGILCMVDGAHAPGQIPLDLHSLGADIYTGACHKWLCAPKGSAFLFVRRELQSWLDPLVISWGYESEDPTDSQFIDYHEWQGTRDLAAFLSVPAAIAFQQSKQWQTLHPLCHTLAVSTRRRIEAITGLASICPDLSFGQMFSVRLPDSVDLDGLKNKLYDTYHIEVPTIRWNGGKFLRVSFQVYNDQQDADCLVQALQDLVG
jgi:isopenicillin-N epimerase